ncbi:hypothetical protein BDR04DRAFT_1098337 [Suillus decipiens]|nr:hypothetical protein BDR04DRAFT_1098337 [Suillus decipiens]
MRLVLIVTLALSHTFVVLSQHAEAAIQVSTHSPTCEEQARQSGLPIDGWRVVYDDGGQMTCRRVSVQELGICRGIEYIDADTKDKECCQDVSGLTWIDRPANLAKCCAKDQVWTFDSGDGSTRGGCCMVGLHMHNGRCIPPYTPPPPPHCPPGTRLIDKRCIPIIVPPPSCPPGTFIQDGICIPVPAQTVSFPAGTCCAPIIVSLHPTYLSDGQLVPSLPSGCPPGTYMHDGMCIQIPNGICPIGTRMQDGQCIPLPQIHGNGHVNVEPPCACTNYPACGHGRHLGIRYGHCYILSFFDSQQLSTARENSMYFRLCRSPHDCSREKEIEMGEPFYLRDQHGFFTDLRSTRGWIDNAHHGNHLGLTLDASRAGRFTGTLACAGGECGIQLHGGDPRVSKKLRFSEVTCDNYYRVPLISI